MSKTQQFLNLLFILSILNVYFYLWDTIAGVPEAVAKLVDDDMVLSAMRNAKFDCEKVIPRTQECILVYDYVAVAKAAGHDLPALDHTDAQENLYNVAKWCQGINAQDYIK